MSPSVLMSPRVTVKHGRRLMPIGTPDAPSSLQHLLCRVVSSILGFLVSPIALLTVVLGLACALVLLRCLVKRAATEASSLQQENRLLRKANRVKFTLRFLQ